MTVTEAVKSGLLEDRAATSGQIWLAAAGMAFFAFAWAVVERLGPHVGVPAAQVVWMRYGVQILLLAAVFGPRAGSGLVRTHSLPLQIARSLLMLAMPLSFIAAMRYLSLREVEAVFWLGIGAFAALRVVHARGANLWLSILSPALAVAGTWLVLQPPQLRIHPAVILPLAMAASYLAYQVLTRAMVEESELSKLFHTALWVFAVLSFVVPFHWHAPSAKGWAAAIGVGILGCGALFALDLAVRLASPFRVAAVSFLQPLFAAVLAAFLHGGSLSWHLLGGGACIILAALTGLPPARPRVVEVP